MKLIALLFSILLAGCVATQPLHSEITLSSGLSYQVDSTAHSRALLGGTTFAVASRCVMVTPQTVSTCEVIGTHWTDHPEGWLEDILGYAVLGAGLYLAAGNIAPSVVNATASGGSAAGGNAVAGASASSRAAASATAVPKIPMRWGH